MEGRGTIGGITIRVAVVGIGLSDGVNPEWIAGAKCDGSEREHAAMPADGFGVPLARSESAHADDSTGVVVGHVGVIDHFDPQRGEETGLIECESFLHPIADLRPTEPHAAREH